MTKQHYLDSRTPEERAEDSKISVVTTTSEDVEKKPEKGRKKP